MSFDPRPNLTSFSPPDLDPPVRRRRRVQRCTASRFRRRRVPSRPSRRARTAATTRRRPTPTRARVGRALTAVTAGRRRRRHRRRRRSRSLAIASGSRTACGSRSTKPSKVIWSAIRRRPGNAANFYVVASTMFSRNIHVDSALRCCTSQTRCSLTRIFVASSYYFSLLTSLPSSDTAR